MPASAREQVTRLLDRIDAGTTPPVRAAAELLPLLYAELKSLAKSRLAREAPAPTLQATALVHEAYVRLVGRGDPGWSGSGHFFAAAAEAMRRILVERARSRGRLKRGGGGARVELGDVATLGVHESEVDVLALDEALRRLAQEDARKVKVVELRYFAGLSFDETAAALDLSVTTVKAEWKFARAWLHRELSR